MHILFLIEGKILVLLTTRMNLVPISYETIETDLCGGHFAIE